MYIIHLHRKGYNRCCQGTRLAVYGMRLFATIELSCATEQEAQNEFGLFINKFPMPDYYVVLSQRRVSEPVLTSSEAT